MELLSSGPANLRPTTGLLGVGQTYYALNTKVLSVWNGSAWDEISLWTTIIKRADEGVSNSTTFVDESELRFTALDGTVYQLEVVILYTGNGSGDQSAADVKVVWGEDTVVRGNLFSMNIGASDADGSAGKITNLTDSKNAGLSTTDDRLRAMLGTGIHVGGGGVFKLQFAQATATPNTTSWIKAGSTLRYRTLNSDKSG